MWYCQTCGSRDIHVEEWHNLNTGEWVCEGAGDFYCGSCQSECGITEDLSEAARARYSQRRRTADGCTCGADYAPGQQPTHPPHCRAVPKRGAA